MAVRFWLIGCVTLTLAACESGSSGENERSSQFIRELPDGVLAIADPYQDLTSVKLEPSDGCYVYRHVGPVETTFLPLRSVTGRPICTRPAETTPTN